MIRSNKKKILVLPYSHTLSHLSRPLAVSKQLVKMGYEVVFGAQSPRVDFIKDDGFEVLPLYEPDPDLLYSNIRNKKLQFISDLDIENMIHSDIDIIDKVQPALVLTDGRFSAPVSTQIRCIPHAAIVNASSTRFRAIPYLPVETNPIHRFVTRFVDEKRVNALVLAFEQQVFDHVMGIFKKLSRKYALQRTVTATNCLEGNDLTLIADVPEYMPCRRLPEHCHYIGPLTWKPGRIMLPDWWPVDKKDKLLLYISMGTTGEADFFDRMHRLIKDSAWIGIMTTGAQTSLAPIPDQLYIAPFIDGDSIMDVADMVVCHGGNGTIYQALAHKVPVIGIPTIPDQAYNMRMVERLNLGAAVSMKDLMERPQVVIETINKIQGDAAIKESVRRFQQVLENYDAAKTGSALIDAVIKNH